MMNEDARRWNGRYTQNGANWLNNQPARLLTDFAHLLPATGLALDAAAGVAVNGRYLAQRNIHTIALDISEAGLRLAQQSANGLPLATAVVDLSQIWLPPNHFDIILNFRFLERATFPLYRQTLKPGGLIFFETYRHAPTNHPDYLLQPDELKSQFMGWEQIHWAVFDKGERTVEQLIARKK